MIVDREKWQKKKKIDVYTFLFFFFFFNIPLWRKCLSPYTRIFLSRLSEFRLGKKKKENYLKLEYILNKIEREREREGK